MLLKRPPFKATGLRLWRLPENSFFTSLKTDVDGFVVTPDAPVSAEIVVALVGGSTLAGFGASSEKHTIANQLQIILNSSSKKIKVVNCGVGRYYSPNEVSTIIHDVIPKIRPSLVVYFNGYNDLNHCKQPLEIYTKGDVNRSENLAEIAEKGEWMRAFFSRYPIQDRSRWAFYKLLSLTRRGSQSSQIKNDIDRQIEIDQVRQIADFKDSQMVGDVSIDGFIYYMRVAKGLANELNLKTLWVIQPLIAYKDCTPIERARATTTGTGEAPTHSGVLFAKQKLFHTKVRTIQCSEHFLTTKFFRASSAVDIWKTTSDQRYFDWCHYNDQGNKEIAIWLAEQPEFRELVK